MCRTFLAKSALLLAKLKLTLILMKLVQKLFYTMRRYLGISASLPAGINVAQIVILAPLFVFCYFMRKWETQDLVPIRPMEGEELPCNQVRSFARLYVNPALVCVAQARCSHDTTRV